MTNNLSSNLQATLTHPDTVRTLLISFFKDSKDQAVALLQKNGVAIANSAPMATVQIAWLKAIKDSQDFRSQAAATLTHYVTTVKAKLPGASNFAGNIARAYYNDVTSTDDSFTIDDIMPPTAAPASVAALPINASAMAPASTTTPAASSSGGSIWDTIGSIFTPKVIQTGISTGLQAYSTNLTAAANASSEKNALTLEQQKLAAAQLAAQQQGTSPVLIVVVSLAAVGLIIGVVLLMRKKK